MLLSIPNTKGQRGVLLFNDMTNSSSFNDWDFVNGGYTDQSANDCPSGTSCWALRTGDDVGHYISTIGYHSIQLTYSIRSRSTGNNWNDYCEVWYHVGFYTTWWSYWTLLRSITSNQFTTTETLNFTDADNQTYFGFSFLADTDSGDRCWINDVMVTGISMKTTNTPTTQPTTQPTVQSTRQPTIQSTMQPSIQPTIQPTIEPTPSSPTPKPTERSINLPSVTTPKFKPLTTATTPPTTKSPTPCSKVKAGLNSDCDSEVSTTLTKSAIQQEDSESSSNGSGIIFLREILIGAAILVSCCCIVIGWIFLCKARAKRKEEHKPTFSSEIGLSSTSKLTVDEGISGKHAENVPSGSDLGIEDGVNASSTNLAKSMSEIRIKIEGNEETKPNLADLADIVAEAEHPNPKPEILTIGHEYQFSEGNIKNVNVNGGNKARNNVINEEEEDDELYEHNNGNNEENDDIYTKGHKQTTDGHDEYVNNEEKDNIDDGHDTDQYIGDDDEFVNDNEKEVGGGGGGGVVMRADTGTPYEPSSSSDSDLDLNINNNEVYNKQLSYNNNGEGIGKFSLR